MLHITDLDAFLLTDLDNPATDIAKFFLRGIMPVLTLCYSGFRLWSLSLELAKNA